MNKLSKSFAIAVMTCASLGLAACQEEKKPEEKPAASAPAPAPEAAAPAPTTESAKPAEATPPAPAAEPMKPAEATPPPAPSSEPAKPAEATTPSPPAPAEPEKKSEAPAAPAPAETAASTPATPPSPPAQSAEASPPAAPATSEMKPEAPTSPAPAETAASTPEATTPAASSEPEKKPEEASAPAPSSQTAEATPSTTPAPAAPAPAASEAKPAEGAGDHQYTPEEIKDRTSPPDPVSELAKQDGYKFEDGRYRNKDGDPQPVVTKDYMVDWGTWNGFRRYHDACHVCHGPNALGSTFAPALKDSLKTIDYSTFVATVSGGKRENKGGTMFVMPSFGEDRNIMCYLDDIYTYIKARSIYDTSGGKDGMPPGRPNGREDISPEARKAADDCTG